MELKIVYCKDYQCIHNLKGRCLKSALHINENGLCFNLEYSWHTIKEMVK